MIPWITNANEDEFAVSTRIRLARNLKDEFFPTMLDFEGIERVNNKVIDLLCDIDKFEVHKLKNISEIEKYAMVEKHLISKEHAAKNRGAIAKINDESLSVMINEEDHFRIQSLISGFDFFKAYEILSGVENRLKPHFAFDEQFGYLTSCPSNAGTGLRASIMIHVPALIMTGQLKNVVTGVTKMGMTLRGMYGEGSEAQGNLVQLSNQITLGLSEKEILENLTAVTKQIIQHEKNARDLLMQTKKTQIEDKIMRSLGVLKFARKLKSNEMMERLSDVKLGCQLGLIQGVTHKEIHNLMMDGMPCLIQLNQNCILKENLRDEVRAKITREILKDTK